MRRLDFPQKLDVRKQRLNKLSPEQIREINEYIDSLGEYGEIHLVVQHGELRYINTVASHKAVGINHGQEKEIYKT